MTTHITNTPDTTDAGAAVSAAADTTADTTAYDAAGRRRPSRAATAVGAVGVLAGLTTYLVGLPAGPTVFGTPLADLSLPAALLLALGGLWLAGSVASAHRRWRVVDIVLASVLGVAGGLLFAVWNANWTPIQTALAGFPPASALVAGVWLLPAVLGALVIRKPGAAVFTELVAAVVSALIGSQWGFSVVWYGLLEGLGAEVVVALLLYRRWGLGAGLAAGAGAGVVVGLLDSLLFYPQFSAEWKLTYIGFAIVSGVVIAGAGAFALTRALARSGALATMPSGRTAERV